MESLPDDVLHQILQFGTKTGRLDHVDLCSLAIVNSRFDGLTRDSSLWATLLCHDFPSSSNYIRAPSKAIYKEQLVNKRKLESLNQRFRHFMFLRPPPCLLPISSNWNSSQSYFPRQVTQVSSRPQSAFVNPIPFSKTDYWYVGPEAGPPPPPSYANASHTSLRQEPKHYYEKKPSNCFDKSSRFQVIPMSKSYVPMNRPPRRSMPRKI